MKDRRKGERRKTLNERDPSLSELAVAVGYLRASVDELSDNITERLKARTRIFRLIVVALILGMVFNGATLTYIVIQEQERREILAEAVLVSCEDRKKVEAGLIRVIELAATPREDDPPEIVNRRLQFQEEAQRLVQTPPCEHPLEPE